ncbi:HLA class II histocompatibility antigen, DR alpha chain-like [Podarcis lilfordi]|uniref:HLA class II histocompatibility antigen, DR alpha chain-like n=1 Tax=Podarcis lilfordi TaxID=74358 RepID=A0AA35K183_9SAUR|nr:HLA class II histocompatibility antigen, DR alpha chain-like [Podarcis lilfordi]
MSPLLSRVNQDLPGSPPENLRGNRKLHKNLKSGRDGAQRRKRRRRRRRKSPLLPLGDPPPRPAKGGRSPESGGHPGGAGLLPGELPFGEEVREFLLEFDNEEILHVDWEKKQNVWRLPDFQRFTSFEVQGALANIAVMKNNMEVLMKRSNRTRALNVAPSATVYPENAVELGGPQRPHLLCGQVLPPSAECHLAEEQRGGLRGRGGDRLLPQRGQHFPQVLLLPLRPCAGRHLRLPGGALGHPRGKDGEDLGFQGALSHPGDDGERAVCPGLGLWHPGHHRWHHPFLQGHEDERSQGLHIMEDSFPDSLFLEPSQLSSFAKSLFCYKSAGRSCFLRVQLILRSFSDNMFDF